MEVKKFFTKFKDKFKTKQNTSISYEYAFSKEELDEISEQNKEKLKQLSTKSKTQEKEKEDFLDREQDVLKVLKKSAGKGNYDELSINKGSNDENNIVEEAKEEDVDKNIDKQNEILSEPSVNKFSANTLTKDEVNFEDLANIENGLEEEERKPTKSFINIDKDYQKIISDKWNSIDKSKLEKDIFKGKDILNHNYAITFADDAYNFICTIRKEYDIIIEYLIGFNNEKKGIYNKTIFSNNLDNEWRFLNKYVMVLEKIKLFLDSNS